MKAFSRTKAKLGEKAALTHGMATGQGRVCEKCNAPTELTPQAALTGKYRCDCGAEYEVISAASDISQFRGMKIDPSVILGNCSAKFFVVSPEQQSR